MLILQHSIPISSLPPSPSMSNFALEDRNPSSTIPIMLFFGFPIWSYPIQPYATSTGCTKSYAKTTQSNLVLYYTHIVKPYMGHTHIHQNAMPTITYNHPHNLHQKIVPPLQATFTSLFHHLLVHETILTITTNTPSLRNSAIFKVPIFT